MCNGKEGRKEKQNIKQLEESDQFFKFKTLKTYFKILHNLSLIKALVF